MSETVKETTVRFTRQYELVCDTQASVHPTQEWVDDFIQRFSHANGRLPFDDEIYEEATQYFEETEDWHETAHARTVESFRNEGEWAGNVL